MGCYAAALVSEPIILLSNDDGVQAKGLRFLREALSAHARVITVAPQTEQSANSHSLTLHRPLRHRRLDEDVHSVDGTPADCIYVALHRNDLVPRRPDLVVSGINHGYNLGVDTYYSGTVAAAREGALRGIDAIAFSMGTKGNLVEGARTAARIAARLLSAPKREPSTPATLLNVNFPPTESYAGVRATRLGRRIYVDGVDVREDPRGREYFWVGGPGAHHEPMEGSDTEAVDEGWVSVTPLILDATSGDGFGLAAWVAAEGQDER